MAHKDIVWTTAGAPEQIDDNTDIKLSTRGVVYKTRLFSRATFNYMMSFDTQGCDIGGSGSEISREVASFATWGEQVEVETFAGRVLHLANEIL
jgi:hypothetical protein